MTKVKVNERISNEELESLPTEVLFRGLYLEFGNRIFIDKILPVYEKHHTGKAKGETTLHLSGIVLTEEEFDNLVSILGKLKEFMSDEDEVEVGRILFGRWKGVKDD